LGHIIFSLSCCLFLLSFFQELGLLSYCLLFQPPGIPPVRDALGQQGCCIIASGVMGHVSPGKSYLSRVGILLLGQISFSGLTPAQTTLLIPTAISW